MTTLTLCLKRKGALGEGQRIPRASQVVLVVKNLPANSGDTRGVGLIPELGRSSGVGNGTPLQYSCLENSMGRWPWWATVHGVTEGQTQLRTNSSKEYPRMLGRQPSPVTLSPPSPRYSLFSMHSSERSF